MNYKPTILLWLLLGIAALAVTWGSWYATIKSMPPVKVLIVGGCK